MSDPLATGILLKLDVTVWTGSAALSAPDLGLDPGTVAAHYTLGRKRLVPKAALDPIATIVRQARYALDGLSHALPGRKPLRPRGGHARGRGAAHPRARTLRRTPSRRSSAAYPRWRADMAPQWDGAARAAWHTAGRPGDATPFVTAFLARVAAAYPMADALRRRFDFFWWTYSLRVAGTERVELIGLADAERARRTADATYRAEVEARVAAALEQSLAGFRAQLAEACQAVLAHLRSGRPLREGAVARLRRTIQRFRALNLVEDDAVESQLATFEQTCLDGLDPAAVQPRPRPARDAHGGAPGGRRGRHRGVAAECADRPRTASLRCRDRGRARRPGGRRGDPRIPRRGVTGARISRWSAIAASHHRAARWSGPSTRRWRPCTRASARPSPTRPGPCCSPAGPAAARPGS